MVTITVTYVIPDNLCFDPDPVGFTRAATHFPPSHINKMPVFDPSQIPGPSDTQARSDFIKNWHAWQAVVAVAKGFTDAQFAINVGNWPPVP